MRDNILKNLTNNKLIKISDIEKEILRILFIQKSAEKQEIKVTPKKTKIDKSKSIEINNKENKIKKSKDKNKSKIFSNSIVIILTFIAIIILIDTFKNSRGNYPVVTSWVTSPLFRSRK